ncbi:MAG: DUF1080 domain-containing protein [Planctomycetes bacterium]|nr:DUF1080 domain-containing protein [Planctomycetota bacterium]
MLRLLGVCVCVFSFGIVSAADEPIVPKESAALFNGKNLDGLTSWLKETKREDPKKVFRVTDGQIHMTGDDFGYLATEKPYKDYRVVVEYKWGKKTDGGKYVRNSGILLHGTGPDGSASGTWMASVECQLAQGCVGDLITIRGKYEKGTTIPVSLTSDVVIGKDKKPRWSEGGTKTVFTGRQLWWNKHQPNFEELLDTRGKDDLDSPLGEFTKVECVCDGSTITVIVNGTTVNKAYDVTPAAGKILLQCEGFEVFVRKFEIHPLKK